jgi:hypothetical protein
MCFRIRFILVMFIAIVSLSLACEVDTKVSIDGRNPPTFTFDGTGYLSFFTVEEIAPENQNVPDVEQDRAKNRTVWSIWPSQPLKTPMKKTAPITYGQVPTGFYQKIPQDGQPPTLTEGRVYEAGGPAASANGGYVRFVVRDGKTVELPTPTRR